MGGVEHAVLGQQDDQLEEGAPAGLVGCRWLEDEGLQQARRRLVLALGVKDARQAILQDGLEHLRVGAAVFAEDLHGLVGARAQFQGDGPLEQLTPLGLAGDGILAGQAQQGRLVVGVQLQRRQQRVNALAPREGPCQGRQPLLGVLLLGGLGVQLEEQGHEEAGRHAADMGPIADVRLAPRKPFDAALQVAEKKKAQHRQGVDLELGADQAEHRHRDDQLLEVTADHEDTHDARYGSRGAHAVKRGVEEEAPDGHAEEPADQAGEEIDEEEAPRAQPLLDRGGESPQEGQVPPKVPGVGMEEHAGQRAEQRGPRQ